MLSKRVSDGNNRIPIFTLILGAIYCLFHSISVVRHSHSIHSSQSSFVITGL